MDRRQLFSLAPLAGGLLALAATAPVQASEGGGSAPANAYIPYGTVTSTIIRPNGQRGVMTVEVGLDVADPALNAQAMLEAPRLRAAFNTVVQGVAAGLLPGRPPDLERLHRALQIATFRTLKKRGAVLLLGSVMVV